MPVPPTPSYRDLKTKNAYLEGRLYDALSANAALTASMDSMREVSREDAAFAGRLAQDAASAEASARAADASRARDNSKLADAAVEKSALANRGQQLEARLQEAAAREERLLKELSVARDEVGAAREAVADLRAESATLQAALRQREDERNGALAHLSTTQAQLSTARADLVAESRALDAVRSEAAELREQLADAARALQAARSANASLDEQARRSEQEASVLAARAQEAAADALNEAEARASAERMAFALREQHVSLMERRDALEKRLAQTETQHRESRKEVRDVGAEAHALAIRMGLYRAVLKSDVANVLASRKK